MSSTITVTIPVLVKTSVHKVSRTLDLAKVETARDGDLATFVHAMIEQGVSIIVARSSNTTSGVNDKIEVEGKRHAALQEGKLDLRASMDEFFAALRQCAASDFDMKATAFKTELDVENVVRSRVLSAIVVAKKIKAGETKRITAVQDSEGYAAEVKRRMDALRDRAQAIVDAQNALPEVTIDEGLLASIDA